MKRNCLGFPFLLLLLFFFSSIGLVAEASCSGSCGALASFYVLTGDDLTHISQLLDASISDIRNYSNIPNADSIQNGTRVKVPFSCDCLSTPNGNFFGHMFEHQTVQGDTYFKISSTIYRNLTTVDALRLFNNYPENNVPVNSPVNVTVNCSCGKSSVSRDYGFFLTYPIRPEDSLASIVSSLGSAPAELVQRYNPNVNFSSGTGIAFIPVKDLTGSYRPLKSSTGLSGGAIAGISVAGITVLLFLGICLYVGVYRKSKVKKAALLPQDPKEDSIQRIRGNAVAVDRTTECVALGNAVAVDRTTESTALVGSRSSGLTGITMDKSVEFSYEELSNATNDFNIANKIGEGGFGSVYYAELRGEKAAIKKMDMKATREFLAELKVLTHVHHLNLVRLIGYCIESSLFLVYEYIENGNLAQHLRGSEREPLSWATRVQIALDSARGLEYIHEHTVPVYIHRDIKSANILIDENFHGKVADFGLSKLIDVGSTSLRTGLVVGTFGYMPPESRFGDVSPKVDVYAFGVVLYELISAKEAVVKTGGSIAESKGLVALFEEVLSQPEPQEELHKLVDPRLGDNCPLDAVHKMAQFAKACTQENPQLRPSMRSIVVALMTLSSSSEVWDVGSSENQALVNLMSGR